MNAETNIKARLPSRHVTEGPAWAAHRSYAMSLATEPPTDSAQVFKRTPYVPDSKPAGRYVAKDMFEVGGTPLLMRTLLDRGHLHGECSTVTGRAVAENMNSVKCPDQDVLRPAIQPVTAGAREMLCYADA